MQRGYEADFVEKKDTFNLLIIKNVVHLQTQKELSVKLQINNYYD